METKQDVKFDAVVMLQVTSPLRTVSDVTESIKELNETGSDAVWTVSASDLHYHPLKQLVVDDEKYFDYYDPAGLEVVARQELKPLFHRNGSCYAFRRDFLVQAESLFSPNSSRAVISRGVRVNIDTETDIKMAEELLNKRSGVD
jgi:CMP-N-acetylneuraminic acid synthetase